ncbi:MAG: hypothetical protein ABI551_06780, partial [Polyangiaceae bacterium]
PTFGARLRLFGARLPITAAKVSGVMLRLFSRARTTAARVALGILPLAAVACTTNGRTDAASESSPTVQDDGFVAHLEPAPGIRFPMPKLGMHLDVASFDRTMPPEKFRYELRLITDADDIEAMIHVWDNPSHLDLRAWFDQNLSGFVGERTSVRERTAGKAALPAIELDEPASDQAFSQSMVLFATRDHVYVVTAIDPDQAPAAKALFEKVVTGFEPEVAPVVGPSNLPATEAK